MVEDKDIRSIILGSRGVYEASSRLVQQAKENGGKDNISIIMASRGPVYKNQVII